MNHVVAALNVGITGIYSCQILLHMVRPGEHVGYTRMLMFACLATIPLAFMLVMVGGRDRWPALLAQARELAAAGPIPVILLALLTILLVLLPLGMLVAVWCGMGLRFGALLVLYFVPVLSRLGLSSAKASVETAVVQAVILFASFFIGIGIVAILERFPAGVETYTRHLQMIWPGYDDAAKMFFSVCVFALANQLIEFRQALLALLGRG